MVTPKNTPLQGTIAASASALRALGNDGILARIVTRCQSRAGGTLEDGKMLAILDEKRKGGTLKGVVKSYLKKQGFDDDTVTDFANGLGHSYKCAIVFTAYVGKGLLAETDYDYGKVNWFIPVCAIENYWDSKECKDVTAEEKAEVRTRIAAILKSREAGTQKALDAIKQSVLPQKGERDEDEGGEGGDLQPDEPVVAAVDGEELARLKAALETATARIGELEGQIAATLEASKVAHSEMEGRLAAALAGMNHLALTCGEMLQIGTEEQLNTFAPALASEHVPDTVRDLLKEIYGQRAEELAGAETAEVEVEQIAA